MIRALAIHQTLIKTKEEGGKKRRTVSERKRKTLPLSDDFKNTKRKRKQHKNIQRESHLPLSSYCCMKERARERERKTMAKPHQEIDHDQDLDLDHPWSTWEELLLACAVNRHGTKSWDFVAMEVQSRVSSPLLLNAHNCRQKYHDLERRFMTVDPQSNGGDHTSTTHEEKTVLWVQQLTKLRVAELKRDVQRSDLSIV